MVDTWYCLDRFVPEGTSQVSRRLKVGNTKQRSLNTRLSSGTSAGTFAVSAGPYRNWHVFNTSSKKGLENRSSRFKPEDLDAFSSFLRGSGPPLKYQVSLLFIITATQLPHVFVFVCLLPPHRLPPPICWECVREVRSDKVAQAPNQIKLCFFVCWFVCWNKTRKPHTPPPVGREVNPLGVITHGQQHKPRAYQRQRHFDKPVLLNLCNGFPPGRWKKIKDEIFWFLGPNLWSHFYSPLSSWRHSGSFLTRTEVH